MFWKQRGESATCLDAGEIVSQVGSVYADYSDQQQLVKPRSSLPCSWFSARECFANDYQANYPHLSDELRGSYHHVYRELAFFVDDGLCEAFNLSLDAAVSSRCKMLRDSGVSPREDFLRNMIASFAVTVMGRDEIWKDLQSYSTCPREHLITLAETLSHCSGVFQSMSDEWTAVANLVAYRYANHT
jgi:hypothetical protein